MVLNHTTHSEFVIQFGQVAQFGATVGQLRQFVTDASHELRTPLAILHGETELVLSRRRSAEEYRKTLGEFDDELKKLTRIVEGLFTLSMADAGQLHLECHPLYINEVLEEACALMASRARAKNISIVRELQEELAYSGDEAFLHQLFGFRRALRRHHDLRILSACRARKNQQACS